MKKLVDYFIKGLLVFVPMALTVFLLIWAFTSLDEAISSVMYLMDNPQAAKDIAEEAYLNVRSHTYDARVHQILKECGFI